MVANPPFFPYEHHADRLFNGRRKLMTVFSGTYNHTVDSKNRLFIPAKFREELGEKFFVMQNIDGCLDIVTIDVRDRIAEQLSNLPRTQSSELKRFLFAGSCDCVPDAQGRVTLPQQLIDYAGLEKNVLIVGAADHIEIWNEESFTQDRESISKDALTATMSEFRW